MVYQAYDKFIRSPKANTPNESKPTAGHAYKGYKKPEVHVEKNDVNNNNRCIWNQQFNMAIAGTLASNITGLASGIIGQLLNGGQEYADYEDVSVQNAPKTETETEKEETVKKLLSSKGIKNISNNMLNDLVKKYDAYRNVYPDWTEEQLANRLYNYEKALEKNNTFIEMQQYYSGNAANIAAKAKECQIEYVDSDLAKIVEESDADKYVQQYLDNAQGTVDMYDTNNDGVISLREFIAKEEKDNGEKLKRNDRAQTKKRFNRLDINNDNKIDNKEMAAYEYLMSRFDDGDSKHTEATITFEEWFGTQNGLSGQEDLKNKFENSIKEYYKEFASD